MDQIKAKCSLKIMPTNKATSKVLEDLSNTKAEHLNIEDILEDEKEGHDSQKVDQSSNSDNREDC